MIRLFSVISWILIGGGGSYPSGEVDIFYSPSRLGKFAFAVNGCFNLFLTICFVYSSSPCIGPSSQLSMCYISIFFLLAHMIMSSNSEASSSVCHHVCLNFGRHICLLPLAAVFVVAVTSSRNTVFSRGFVRWSNANVKVIICLDNNNTNTILMGTYFVPYNSFISHTWPLRGVTN